MEIKLKGVLLWEISEKEGQRIKKTFYQMKVLFWITWCFQAWKRKYCLVNKPNFNCLQTSVFDDTKIT